jgi:hypothetical protein
MRTEYTYTVSVDNENNEEWVDLYNGKDLTAAETSYNEYKFIEGDQRLQLSQYELTWRYEGQKVPDRDPTPKTLKERYQ